jgi:hypothetical protein
MLQLKKYILNMMIGICRHIPLYNNNISKLVRYIHMCLPLTSIIPCLVLPIQYIFIIHIYLILTVITQVLFDTCILTDLEEFFYTGEDKYISVVSTILIHLDIEPTFNTKLILTQIITITIITIVLCITYYRTKYTHSKTSSF